MGFLKKPQVHISIEEEARNRAYIESIKKMFPKKTVKATATYKKDKSKQEFVESGRFVDEKAARSHFLSFLEDLNKIDSSWKIVDIDVVKLHEETTEEEN